MQTRYSKQRAEIYNELKNTKSHPTAEWIYERVREKDPTISLGTVYRNLAYLCKEGQVIALDTADKKTHYDACVTDHAHFVCNACGRVYDIEQDIVAAEKLEQKGFKAERVSCVFYGMCPDCGQVR